MKLGSLFDGEAGFPLSGSFVGIEPVWASEIEPYPIAISHSRFPNMKHIGDVSMCNGAELEPVDIITFGSPCQDMSVAGKRNGMKHEDQGDEETTRSGLFFEAARIITEMRTSTNGKNPRFAVWENVPGAFSSNGGHDFHAVLSTLAAIAEPGVSIPEPERDSKTNNLIWLTVGCIVGNGWSIAWRTLDAQYWGVPQRRRRIYLVADFRTERAAEILFEPYSLRGDTAESGEARERVAADAIGCVGGSGEVIGFTNRGYESGNHAETLRSEPHGAIPMVAQSIETYHCENHEEQVSTLKAMDWKDPQCVVCAFDSLSSNSMKSSNPNSGCREVDVAKCIDTTYPDPSKNQGGVCVVQPVIALQANGIDRADTASCNGAGWREDQMYTLNTVDKHAVVYPETYQQQVGALCSTDYKWVQQQQVEQNKLIVSKNVYPATCGTFQANSGAPREGRGNDVVCLPLVTGTLAANGGGLNRPAGNCIETDFCIVNCDLDKRYIVRRLMPIETTRLQGYPDWWHDLAPFDGNVTFWESVRETWARITGVAYKPFKDIARLEKWYYGLRNDGAEYKVDGNSLAIPCAAYVIRRIAEASKEGLTFDT